MNRKIIGELPREDLFLKYCDPNKKHQINLIWYRKLIESSDTSRIDVVVSSRNLKGEDISPSDFLFRTHQYEILFIPNSNFKEWTSNCRFYAEVKLMKEIENSENKRFEEYLPNGKPVIKTTWCDRIRTWVLILDVEPPDTPTEKIKYRGVFCFKLTVFRRTDPGTYRKIFESVSSDFEIVSKPGVFFRRRKKGKKGKKLGVSNDLVNRILRSKKVKKKRTRLRTKKNLKDEDEEDDECEEDDDYDESLYCYEQHDFIEVPDWKRRILEDDDVNISIPPPPPPQRFQTNNFRFKSRRVDDEDEEEEEEEEEEQDKNLFPEIKNEIKVKSSKFVISQQSTDDDNNDREDISGRKRKRTNEFYGESQNEEPSQTGIGGVYDLAGEILALPTPVLPTPLGLGMNSLSLFAALSQNSSASSRSFMYSSQPISAPQQPPMKKRKLMDDSQQSLTEEKQSESQSQQPNDVMSPLTPFHSLDISSQRGLLSLSFDSGSVFSGGNSQNQQRAWDEVILSPIVNNPNNRIAQKLSQSLSQD